MPPAFPGRAAQALVYAPLLGPSSESLSVPCARRLGWRCYLLSHRRNNSLCTTPISSTEEATVSRIGSTIVLVGALIWVLSAPNYAITLQLAGGVWILQTLPAVFLALYIR